MKATYSFIIVVLAFVAALPLQAETESSYSDPTLKSILLEIEDYRNDRVTYKAVYTGFAKNPPAHFENNSRFREGKHVLIKAGSLQLPVVAELDDVKPILEELRHGALVQLNGKIRELDRDRKKGFGSGYYLELEGFEVIDPDFKHHHKAGNKKAKKLAVKDGA